jgi:hypothetical protein
MSGLLTSNQLSLIYGNSPTRVSGNSNGLWRGFVIAISITANGIRGEVYYRDFPDPHQSDVYQIEFERVVIAGTAGKPFKEDISRIDFGWSPCHVSYVLLSPFARFIDSGTINQQETHFPSLIFRRDKIVLVEDTDPTSKFSRKAAIQQYIANHSFSDLKFDEYNGCTILRFRNEMKVNALGEDLGRPPSDQQQKKRRRFDYCMDIPIEINAMRMVELLGQTSFGSNGLPAVSATKEPIIIVFDPPQGNGGGNGPPEYP